MSKWTTLFSGFSILLLIFSCKPYQPVFDTQENSSQTLVNNFFSDVDKDYVYKAAISVYGHDVSGILIIKKIGETTHRVVMTTEFGNTLMDMELQGKNYTVKNVVPQLNKKIVLNTLAKDFSLLLTPNYSVTQKFSRQNEVFYLSPDGKNKHYVWTNTEGDISKIVLASGSKEKLSVHFESKSGIFAEELWIEHKNISLQIHLKML